MKWVGAALAMGATVGLITLLADEEEWPALPPGWSWERLTQSATADRLGLDNTPPPAARRNLGRLAWEVLWPLEKRVGRRVLVTSGYRSPAVNAAVGGVPGSAHTLGEAADVAVPGMAPQLVQQHLWVGSRQYVEHVHVRLHG